MGAKIGVLLNCGQQSQFSKVRREFDAGRVNLDPPMTCADWPVPGNLTLLHPQTAYTRKPLHREGTPSAYTLSRIFLKSEPKLDRGVLEDSVGSHGTQTIRDINEDVIIFEIFHINCHYGCRNRKDQICNTTGLVHTCRHMDYPIGLPYEQRRCPKPILDYWNICDEQESSPLVINGDRIEIPSEQRQ